ncbi:L,D-transpeptidase family protein [Shewanella marinintestina]|uniref:L,D-transpeptidase family protein n=1 Tax=Shewanella marinintestina TaxID=190305 RepID=UPI00200C742E|nr:L,D-transpeptidase family protein [Shewanella marinintestina]MCL1144568.1 L,D-transpeptidase family protein [Shewanella marinintestina]
MVETSVNLAILQKLNGLVEDLGLTTKLPNYTDSNSFVTILNDQIFDLAQLKEAKSLGFYLEIIDEKDIYDCRRHIERYKKLNKYIWPKITFIDLKKGQRNKDVAKIRWILSRLGDIKEYQLSSYREKIFDTSIEQGLKNFQLRHGLETSGKLDYETVISLNVLPEHRLEQLQNQLAYLITRRAKSKEYIEVNLASYMLKIKNRGQEKLQMPVIVGNTSNKTPLLSTFVTNITVNPSWTPPTSIIYTDILASVELKPNYLKTNRFVFKDTNGGNKTLNLDNVSVSDFKSYVKQYKLVQRAGKYNALGKYRFTIPNDFTIYLHDTPTKNLFNLKERSLSHGCIRLFRPELFAKYLINRESSSTMELFSSAETKTKTERFTLARPLPIYIVSNPTWVDRMGDLQIRDDYSF